MYHGPTSDLVPWFTGSLGYTFDRAANGSPADWALDLVSLGFSKVQAAPTPGASAADLAGQVNGGGGGDGGRGRGGGDGGGGGGGAPSSSRPAGATRRGMTTPGELQAAAAAMRARLEAAQPEWFEAPAPAPHGGLARALGSASGSAGALSAAGGGGPAGSKGVGYAARLLWRHYRALLWRETAVLTRNPADAAGRMLTCAPAGWALAPRFAWGTRGSAAAPALPKAGIAPQPPFPFRSPFALPPQSSPPPRFTYVALLNGLIHYGMSADAASLQNRVGVGGRPARRARGDRGWHESSSAPMPLAAARRRVPYHTRPELPFPPPPSPPAAAPHARPATRCLPSSCSCRLCSWASSGARRPSTWPTPRRGSTTPRPTSPPRHGARLGGGLLLASLRLCLAPAASAPPLPSPRSPSRHPAPCRQVTAVLPFNVAVALAFQLVFYGLAGLRHGPVYVVQSTVIAVLVALIANQVGRLGAPPRGGRGGRLRGAGAGGSGWEKAGQGQPRAAKRCWRLPADTPPLLHCPSPAHPLPPDHLLLRHGGALPGSGLRPGHRVDRAQPAGVRLLPALLHVHPQGVGGGQGGGGGGWSPGWRPG
jgi:hypothetical protein